MRKHLRTYMAWSAFGTLSGPVLWMLFAAWHVSQYHPELGTFANVFREWMARTLATGKEIPLLLSMSMPAGAILFVVIRAVVAVIASGISRLGPHGKGRRTVGEPG